MRGLKTQGRLLHLGEELIHLDVAIDSGLEPDEELLGLLRRNVELD